MKGINHADILAVSKWAIAGTFYTDIAQPKFMHGLLAMCAMDLLNLGSLSIVRQKCYTLFLCSHILGFAALTFGVCLS